MAEENATEKYEEIEARCQYSLFPRRPLPPLYAFKFLIFVNIAVDGGGKIVVQ